jgi:hypothetical protein
VIGVEKLVALHRVIMRLIDQIAERQTDVSILVIQLDRHAALPASMRQDCHGGRAPRA